MNTTLQKSLACVLCQCLALGAASLGDGQEATSPVKVVIKDCGSIGTEQLVSVAIQIPAFTIAAGLVADGTSPGQGSLTPPCGQVRRHSGTDVAEASRSTR